MTTSATAGGMALDRLDDNSWLIFHKTILILIICHNSTNRAAVYGVMTPLAARLGTISQAAP